MMRFVERKLHKSTTKQNNPQANLLQYDLVLKEGTDRGSSCRIFLAPLEADNHFPSTQW